MEMLGVVGVVFGIIAWGLVGSLRKDFDALNKDLRGLWRPQRTISTRGKINFAPRRIAQKILGTPRPVGCMIANRHWPGASGVRRSSQNHH